MRPLPYHVLWRRPWWESWGGSQWRWWSWDQRQEPWAGGVRLGRRWGGATVLERRRWYHRRTHRAENRTRLALRSFPSVFSGSRLVPQISWAPSGLPISPSPHPRAQGLVGSWDSIKVSPGRATREPGNVPERVNDTLEEGASEVKGLDTTSAFQKCGSATGVRERRDGAGGSPARQEPSPHPPSCLHSRLRDRRAASRHGRDSDAPEPATVL